MAVTCQNKIVMLIFMGLHFPLEQKMLASILLALKRQLGLSERPFIVQNCVLANKVPLCGNKLRVGLQTVLYPSRTERKKQRKHHQLAQRLYR